MIILNVTLADSYKRSSASDKMENYLIHFFLSFPLCMSATKSTPIHINSTLADFMPFWLMIIIIIIIQLNAVAVAVQASSLVMLEILYHISDMFFSFVDHKQNNIILLIRSLYYFSKRLQDVDILLIFFSFSKP